ncbi:transmembrane protein 237A [Triplophysa dalaica]|uniref:transmembrane protein 237A n=1 Tax=Triplophysa dalaica TaxID=1582913 RepID=UPI0024DF7C7C|nr:transmembrane protein 237A [Triplophysa dalaica]
MVYARDDTTVVGLIKDDDESAYRDEVQHLAVGCATNNLELNTQKTKEIIVDFRRTRSHAHTPIYINGAVVERVSGFKFLGIHISDDLTWILVEFYCRTIESILTYCISVWYSNCSASDRKALQRVVKTAQRITGTQLTSIENIHHNRCLEQALEMEGVESRRQSESREPLNPETQENPPKKKKKKKKAHTLDHDEQQELTNGDVHEPHTDGEEVTKKSKKKRKAKMLENQSHNELTVEEGDIITDLHAQISQRSLFSAPLVHSHPIGKLFVEKKKRFQAFDRLDSANDQLEEYMEDRPMWKTRDVAMRVHSGFR